MLMQFAQVCLIVLVLLSPNAAGVISLDQQKSDRIVPSQAFDKSEVVPIGEKVLLQPYFWGVPWKENWWQMLADQVPEFAADGFDSLWLPPPTKTRAGFPANGGYEPFDYYDLGEFDQMDGISTRYGTRAELENLIQLANEHQIGVIADIVINHRMGGSPEQNPNTGTITDTNFMDVLSGRLKMNYSHFYPNEYAQGDSGAYGHFPDIAHKHPYVQEELVKWGLWMRDEIGFDGFRFDSANLMDAFMFKHWMQNVTGTWGVAEYWMEFPDASVVDAYLEEANNSLTGMDFAQLVEVRDMANYQGDYDMQRLAEIGLAKIRPDAVTVAVNHDSYRDKFNIEVNRHMAYAYILTTPGYPSVFWMDYVDPDLRNHIKALVDVHNSYAKGEFSILHVDEDIYVGQWDGEPGLITVINDNPNSTASITVQSSVFSGVTLNDLVGMSSSADVDQNGQVTLSAPPSGYAVYSTGSPVARLHDYFYPREQPEISEIVLADIVLDGDLDESYLRPIAADRRGDANGLVTDLNNLYAAHDNEYLYLLFGYNRFIEWQDDFVEFGIAIDTKEGGSYLDPLHSKIKWGGSPGLNKPDHLYYFTTNESVNDYKREILSAQHFRSVDSETWSTGEVFSASNYISHPYVGTIEVRIPISSLDIANDNLAIKVFSTVQGFEGAKDSVPHDLTLDQSGEGDSWLFMGDPIPISIEPASSIESSSSDTSTTTEDSSSESQSETSAFLPNWLMSLFLLTIIVHKRKFFKVK